MKKYKLIFLICSFLGLAFYLSTQIIHPSEVYSFETEEGMLSHGNIEQRLPPYSTFKLPLSLFLSENEDKPKSWIWNGKKHNIESWNSNQTEESWIKNSCVWVSKKIIQQSSQEKIQSFLNHLGYGNKVINDQTFWLDETLTISVGEQINILKQLLKNKKFKISLFKISSSTNYTLYGKTGTGQKGGWFVGWVEKNKKNYPFAYFKRNSTGQKSKESVLKKLKQLFK